MTTKKEPKKEPKKLAPSIVGEILSDYNAALRVLTWLRDERYGLANVNLRLFAQRFALVGGTNQEREVLQRILTEIAGPEEEC